ncbi:MAG: amino acid ABC transporter permease [Clostridia bacterium]|nr:amino acid ABC transporter permease [Oscillospiraceae bacterium]MBQ6797421.1 amino acid ABC transporter permease [Clostridia bacterium]
MPNFDKKWEVFVRSFIDNEGYKRVLEGLQNTLLIALVGLVIGIAIGTLIAVVRVMPKYGVLPKILNGICSVYTEFFRGTPIVVQLLLGYYVLLPLLGVSMKPVGVCILIFGLNSGAYVSEIMRGGIGSVDPGQMEAGRALGMSYWATMLKIVVPQAVKNILPTLGNELISLVKETSVVSFVGALDLSNAFRYIASNNYEFMIPYLVMAVIYILIVLVIAVFIRLMERRLKKSDRSN